MRRREIFLTRNQFVKYVSRPYLRPMKILFLCLANSARSQMAEALARKVFGDQVEVYSAGLQPIGYVHPWAKAAMSEIGIDIGQQRSKSFLEIPEDFFSGLDVVVKMCADELCPSVSSPALTIRWDVQDPALDPEDCRLDTFRRTRDELEFLIRSLREPRNTAERAARLA